MTRTRTLRMLSLIAVISLLATSLPSLAGAATQSSGTTGSSHSSHGTAGSSTSSSSSSSQNSAVPPDLDSWQQPSSTPPADTSHPTGAQGQGSTVMRPGPFADITNHWAAADIAALYSQGIINGVGAGKFDPERPVSRAELVKMLVTVARVPAGTSSTAAGKGVDLSRVNTKAWYYPFVMSAVSAGIIRATDGRFEPDGPATRELFAAWAVRAAGKENLSSLAAGAAAGYRDYQQISAWARGYVGMAKELGVMQGYGGMFVPQAPVTRAEAAAMLMRLMELDVTPATVRLNGRSNTAISLVFSEPVNQESAELLANYEIPGLRVTNAKLQVDGKTVILTTTAQTVGQTYQVRVRNVRDAAWNIMAPAALSLALSAGPIPGKPVYKDSRHVEIPFDKDLAAKPAVQLKVVNKATGKVFGNPYGVEAAGKKLTIMFSSELVPGTTYTISLAGVRDKAGAEMAPATLEFSVSTAVAPPAVKNVTVTGSNTFVVEFTKPLKDAGTYTATGFVSATPTFIDSAKTRVRVTATTTDNSGGFADQVPYTVTIANVVGSDGKSVPQTTQRITYARERVAPGVQSVKALGPAAIEVLFTEPVEEWSAKSLSNYTLVRQNTADYFTWSATRTPYLSADGKTLRLYLEDGMEFAAGARYELTASGVRDLVGNAMPALRRTFVFAADQAVVLLPVAVDVEFSRITGGNSLQVVFTRPVDAVTGRTVANYDIAEANDLSAELKVLSAEIDATDSTGRTVKLVTDPITTDLRLTVRNVKDTSGTTVVPTAVSLQRNADDWYVVTAARAFNDRVELTLSESTFDFPEVKIYRTGTTEPASPIFDIEIVDDGRTISVPFDFAALGANGFGRAFTVKVAGGGLVPTTWSVTPVRDTVAPVVERVTGLDQNKVSVTFSEEVMVEEGKVTIGSLPLSSSTMGFARTWIFSIPDADGEAGTDDFLRAGSNQTLVIAGGSVRDRNVLLMAQEVKVPFTVARDLVRPVVRSVVAVGANTVKVTFSEPVTASADSFEVEKVGTSAPITVLSVEQTKLEEVVLTLDLTTSPNREEYEVSTTGEIWDQAVTPNASLPARYRFWSHKTATRSPALIALAQDASSTRVETLVTDNTAGQQDRIHGEVGSVDANVFVMIYVDGTLKAVTKATAYGAFGPVSIGDYDSPREIRIVAVDGDANTGETTAVVGFSR